MSQILKYEQLSIVQPTVHDTLTYFFLQLHFQSHTDFLILVIISNKQPSQLQLKHLRKGEEQGVAMVTDFLSFTMLMDKRQERHKASVVLIHNDKLFLPVWLCLSHFLILDTSSLKE